MNAKFPWNNSETVRKEYDKDNILILETGIKSKKALIFFSSNGIYFPNEEMCLLSRLL